MKKVVYRMCLIVGLGLLLSGCETTGGSDSISASDTALSADKDAESFGAKSDGIGARSGAGSGLSGDDSGFNGNPLSKRIIYFLYDSAEIKPEYIPVIEAHAKYLIGHPQIRVKLEGHADERGSREYNIALAEQRAYSVSRKLEVLGVNPGQLSLVSYGEEKPVSYDHDETAWQLNRRVEIRYPGY